MFTLVLMSGCVHRIDERLCHAEAIIEEHPDSALMILEDIDVAELSTEEDVVLYGLLLTQSMDKEHLDPVNDTIISVAVDFYTRNEDLPNLIKATYYQGRVHYHRGNNPSAIVAFVSAKELAENDSDFFWAGMACRGVAHIYNKTYNATEELNYAQMAFDFIKKSGRQPYLNYSLYDLGGAMHNVHKNDEAIRISEQLSDSASVFKDHYLSYISSQLKVLCLLSEEKFIKAAPYIDELFRGDFAEELDSLNYCELLLASGELTEAHSLMTEIADQSSIHMSYLRYSYLKESGDYFNALRTGEVLDSLTNSDFQKAVAHNLATTLTDYYQMKNDLGEAKIKAANATIVSIIFVSIFSVAILIGIARFIYLRQNRKIEAKVVLAEQLQESLEKSNVENDNSRAKIKILLSKQYELIEELGEIAYQSSNTKDARKKIADRITAVFEEMSVKRDKIESLEKEVDSVHNNLFSDFRKDLPNLKDADYKLYLFSILGLSSVVICFFLKEETVNSVYNRKRHLKDKIKQLEPEKRERYLQFFK